MIIWSILLLEPLSANFNIKNNYSYCSENLVIQSSCCESECGKPADKEDENDCENNRCNPIMSCPTGNFYLFGHAHLSISPFTQSKVKSVLINDNRIAKHIADCWHPPEII